jgi:hypothetical protein
LEPVALLLGLTQVAMGFARIGFADLLGVPSFGALLVFLALEAACQSYHTIWAFTAFSLALLARTVVEAVQPAAVEADVAAAIHASYELYVLPAASSAMYTQLPL